MLGKKKSLFILIKELKSINDLSFVVTEFCQGNTIRWGIAWTFLHNVNFTVQPKKSKKEKPPFSFTIPKSSKGSCYSISEILEKLRLLLEELQISHVTTHQTNKDAHLWIKSNVNTWIHQRQKRRKLNQNKNMLSDNATNLSLPIDTNTYYQCNAAHPSIVNNIGIGTKTDCIKLNDVLDDHKNNMEIKVVPIESEKNDISRSCKRKSNEINSALSCWSKCSNNCLCDVTLKRKNSIPCPEFNDVNNQCGIDNADILLHCSLLLTKLNNSLVLQTKCAKNSKRESMYEIFQFLKNRLN